MAPSLGQCMVDSSDMELIWGEVQAARGVLRDLQEMRGGRVGETPVTVVQEVRFPSRVNFFLSADQ